MPVTAAASKAESPGWTRVAGRPGGRTVLAVDFDGTVRGEATFRDLARSLPDDIEFWHATVLDTRRGDTVDSARYLDWWLNTPAADTGIVAVLGYCAGSVFASALADALKARSGRRPPTLLFNPGVPTVATLERDFRGVVESMTALTQDERDALHSRTADALKRCGPDFDAAGAELSAIYLDACSTVFERWGIEDDIGEELGDLFRSYVFYLTAARQIERSPAWSSALSVTSRDQAGSGFTDHETSFDLARSDLLRSQEVVSAVYGVLAAEA